MKFLTNADLLGYEEYERVRESFRQRIIELKRRRRISIGDSITLVFENRDTIQFQVQEMIRAERIVDPVKVQEELDVYNQLLPGKDELSATLFIEITDSQDLKRDLDAFQGIDRGQTVAIMVGSHVAYGEFEGGHSKEDKISAVHFVHWRIPCPMAEALADSTQAAELSVHHAGYRAQTPVPSDLRQEWRRDLAG
jgi:hypothetical protein